MIAKKVTYTDYNGLERTETFYFNLTEAETLEWEMSATGGLTAYIEKIVAANEMPAIISVFKELVLKAYGEKSADGRRFIKNDEVRDAFAQTEAYSKIFMELATDAEKAAEFVNGITPKKANNEVQVTKRPEAIPIKAD